MPGRRERGPPWLSKKQGAEDKSCGQRGSRDQILLEGLIGYGKEMEDSE